MDKVKAEKKFIERLKEYPDLFHMADKKSVMEGFQYYNTDEYRSKQGAVKNRPKTLLTNQPLREIIRLGKHMTGKMPQMLKNINKNYSDMNEMLTTLKNEGTLIESSASIVESYPNEALWQALKQFAWDKYRLIVGFTEVPREYIFEGKAIPFRYALVFAQEMNKQAIEKAPLLDAGMEVMNVYNSLGIAVNEIAEWLRNKHNIVCMANHPLGGLTDTVPLAMKAGLGYIGRSGLLITKEFGPRCRIAPIYIDQKIFYFTDSNEHKWIVDFCKECGSCSRACPVNAIYDKPKLSVKFGNDLIPNRYQSYDREKCFTSFSATMGCGVCISVCPFSKNPSAYDRMKKITLQRKG